MVWSGGDVGGWECMSKIFVTVEVERREKIAGYVRRGGGSEYGVGVLLTLEVGVSE